MTYNPSAVDEWIDAAMRFAQYRGELVEVLRWLGEEFVKKATEGHPPGGPHPGPGAMPEYGVHSYIDRTMLLTETIGFSLEAMPGWDPTTGTAAAIPTLFVYATAPYAELVEYGTATSRPYPFFWNSLELLLPEALAKVQAVMARADAVKVGQR